MSQDNLIEIIADIKSSLNDISTFESVEERRNALSSIEEIIDSLKGEMDSDKRNSNYEELIKQFASCKINVLESSNIASQKCDSVYTSKSNESDYIIDNFNEFRGTYYAAQFAKDDGNVEQYLSGMKQLVSNVLNLYHVGHQLHNDIYDFYKKIKKELEEAYNLYNTSNVNKEYDKYLFDLINGENSEYSSDSAPSSPPPTQWSEVVSRKNKVFGIKSSGDLTVADRIRYNIPMNPKIPGSVPKKNLHDKATHLKTKIILNRSTGNGFESLFGEYIRKHKRDANYRPIEEIIVQDPYLTQDIQMKNILDFLDYCIINISTLRRFEIKTAAAKTSRNAANIRKLAGNRFNDNKILKILDHNDRKLKCQMADVESHCRMSGIEFKVEYIPEVHERYIFFDNGIWVSLERGFDFFYHNCNNPSDRDTWECKETKITFYCL
uniref:MIT_C domain-containing protein n=1 Tax=Parastrongyloides trichosuri TaxID=131310 RepID=A0A0N4ZI85_PARTI